MARVVHLYFLASIAQAQMPCQDDSWCPANSKCLGNEGLCSNPMEKGCLQTILGEKYDTRTRTCSSDDDTGAEELGLCRPNLFAYPEIRILPQNWQEPTFFAWVLQIMLSEIANVPVTMETTGSASFYDQVMHWDYASKSYDYDALRAANDAPQNNCNVVEGPCAHVMSEVWSGQRQEWREAEQEGLIEPAGNNGRTASYNWYIPKFVAEEDPSLVSFYGLRGENNRRKLAQRFKRPVSWEQYCQEMSSDQCQTPDETALRPPQNAEEEASYFWEDSNSTTFSGFFRATPENDCETYPTNCTGHIVNYECTQSTFVVAQAHWLNISLKSSGPEANGTGGYPSNGIMQIWRAANATNSSVMVYFANTNPQQLPFQGTPFEFQRILLPAPTAECIANRVSPEDRCSSDLSRQMGSPLGSCDTDLLSLKKYVIGSLRTNTFTQEEASVSPAYDMIRAMEISTLEMLSIMNRWQQDHDEERHYGSRYAVCHWVAQNIDTLVSKMVPPSYPRDQQEQSFYIGPHSALLFVALAFGGIALLAVLVCFGLTWHWKQRQVIVYAQPEFLYLVLMGLSLVAISAILHATPPSNGTCIARTWTKILGYSMELVPLIVKVNAINYLFNQAMRNRRVTIDKKKLYRTVAAVMVCVVVYVILWTAIDPPTKQAKTVLTNAVNDGGGSTVQMSYSCASSDSPFWSIAAMVYLMVLLLTATVMATQSRNVDASFNETKYLAAMIYSHFLFMLLRVLLFFFGDKVIKINSGAVVAGVMSLFLSLDAMICMGIYFYPKFRHARNQSTYSMSARGTIDRR